MKKIIIFLAAMCSTLISKAQTTQPNNEIWYTTTDGKIYEIQEDYMGEDTYIVDHYYDSEKGCCVIKCNNSISVIRGRIFENLWESEKNWVTSVSIPASVTHIADDAFYGCYYLTALSLAAGSQLENIGCNAFNGTGLSGELTLPASVKIIGDYAFEGCKLSKVYMSSEDLSGISKGAFEHINELVLHVPAYLYEKYKSHFSGYNTVEAPTLDEWKQFAKDEIKAAFDKLTYVTDNDKLSLSLHFQGIDEAEDKNAIDNYRKEAMDWISERESFCEQIKSLFGSMAAKQSGPAVEVIKGDKKVILYSPDKVNFIKVNE